MINFYKNKVPILKGLLPMINLQIQQFILFIVFVINFILR
jgi:hypothetical protein